MPKSMPSHRFATSRLAPLTLFLLATACSKELSRPDAAALIKSGAHFPETEARVIECFYYKYDHPLQGWPSPWGKSDGSQYVAPVEDTKEIEFLTASYMTVHFEGRRAGGLQAVLTPLPQARQFIIDDSDPYRISLKICDIDFNDVTGIRQAPNSTTAIVDYTVRRTNWTPIGEFYKRWEPARWPELLTRTALLERYDDGWRLTTAATNKNE